MLGTLGLNSKVFSQIPVIYLGGVVFRERADAIVLMLWQLRSDMVPSSHGMISRSGNFVPLPLRSLMNESVVGMKVSEMQIWGT